MAKRNKTSVAAARRRQEMARNVTPTAQAATQPVDFREEYRYVLADLKRFGLLAVSMIALLVILALVL